MNIQRTESTQETEYEYGGRTVHWPKVNWPNVEETDRRIKEGIDKPRWGRRVRIRY